MKVIIILFAFFITLSTSAQVSILSIDYGTVGECDGSISLQSNEFPLDFTLQGTTGDIDHQFIEPLLILNELCKGDYTIVYYDELGCEVKVEFSIIDCPEIDFGVDIINTCFNDQSGKIRLQVPNNGNHYDLIWSNGMQGYINEDLVTGDYIVTITDQNNCITENTYTVENSNPKIVLTNLSDLDGIGNLTIDIIDSEGPFIIDWQDPSSIIQSISSDGLELTLDNSNQIASILKVTVEDSNGCHTMRKFTIPACIVPGSIDFFVDLIGSSGCEESDNLQLTITSVTEFVNYQVERFSSPSNTWILTSQGETEVSTNSDGKRYINVDVLGTSINKITLTNECNESKTVTQLIQCDCENTIAPLGVFHIEECSLTNDTKVVMLRQEVDIEVICISSNYFPNSGICAFEYPYTYIVELDDKSVFEVKANNNGFLKWKTLIPSSKVDPENGDFSYEIEEEGRYYHKITNGPGCSNEYYYNLEFTSTYPISGAGFLEVQGQTAQGINFICNSCRDPLFPYSFSLSNLNQFCKNGSLEWDYFQWGVFDLEHPFSGGGVYNVWNAGQVLIPAGSPFIEIPLGQSFDPDCRAALFAWQYASGPVHQGYPIFVVYCPEELPDEEDESGCLIDCNCDNEWPEEIGDCNLEVTCLDDPNNPEITGIIPNPNSITPCQVLMGTGCEVIGFCLESNAYYQYENGDYYYYNDLDCSVSGIPYCSDVENGTADLYDPNCDNPCQIYQNSPNPFDQNAETTIPICINTSGIPQLLVYDNPDCNGSPVFTMYNNNTIAGNSNFIIPAGTLSPGVYHYKFENNGCTSEVLSMIALAFKGEDNQSETRKKGEVINIPPQRNSEIGFTVFPNPNKGSFSLKNEFNTEIKSLALISINGKRIPVSISKNAQLINIQMDDVVSGLYFLEILTMNKSTVLKVVVN